VPGIVGEALQFERGGGISTPASQHVDFGRGEEFTVEVWAKSVPGETGLEGNEVMVGRDDDTAGLHWWLGTRGSGQASFTVQDVDRNIFSIKGLDSATDGDWHHIVGVNAVGSDRLLLYVDGRLVGSRTSAFTGHFASQEASLDIGWLNLGGLYRVMGTLDEVAIHRRQLLAAEVRERTAAAFRGERGCTELGSARLTLDGTAADGTFLTGDLGEIRLGEQGPVSLEVAPGNYQVHLRHWWGHAVLSCAGGIASQSGRQVSLDLAPGLDVVCTLGVNDALPCPTAITHLWRLDGDGAQWADSAGQAAGTCPPATCPVSVADGRVGGAHAFSRTGIDIASADVDWEGRQSFTVQYWMKRDPNAAVEKNEVIVGREDWPVHWWTGMWDDGTASFVILSSLHEVKEESGALRSSTSINDNEWHLITAVHDAESEEIRLYVDGRLEDRATKYFGGDFVASTPLQLGYLTDDWWYHGIMDEAAIYGLALDDDEIQRQFDLGSEGQSVCQ
jgi:hypothetical protein